MADKILFQLTGHSAAFIYAQLVLELLVLSRTPKRPWWCLRLAVGLPLFLALLFTVPVLLGALIPNALSHVMALIGSTVIFLCTAAFHRLWLDISSEELLLQCVFCYILQNFSRRLSVILLLSVPGLPFGFFFWEILFAVLTSLTCYLLLVRTGYLEQLLEQFKNSRASVLLVGITMLSLILLTNTMFGLDGLDTNLFCNIAVGIFDAIAIVLLYMMLQNVSLEQNNQVVHQLLQSERKQYKMSQESISIVNMKCHDLKHQIASIRAVSRADQQEALRELESAVMIYDTIAKTGNETLDTVLTEKGLYCEQHHIILTYTVDQEKLSFINGVDLYALFSNGLDNAIESVMKEEHENRVISLRHRPRQPAQHPFGKHLQPSAPVCKRKAGYHQGGSAESRLWYPEHSVPGQKIQRKRCISYGRPDFYSGCDDPHPFQYIESPEFSGAMYIQFIKVHALVNCIF